MTSPRSTQGGRPTFRRGGRRRRQCFCKETKVDYKDISNIRRFITDRGRIEPGKKSGNCAKCQRTLTTAIKRARHLALLPYAPHHLRVTGEVAEGNKAKEKADDSIDDLEESNEVTESTEENQVDVESTVIETDAEPESEVQSEASETIVEAKSDESDEEGDVEDSNNVASESGENTDGESDDSEEDK